VSPEKNLWLEVLSLALADFCSDRPRAVRGRNSMKNYQPEAARWFESSSRDPGTYRKTVIDSLKLPARH
jgi:hypothetical protein